MLTRRSLAFADVIDHWKSLADQAQGDYKPFGEKKLKSILEVPGRESLPSSRASPANETMTSFRQAPAATPPSVGAAMGGMAATSGGSEVEQLRTQLAQAKADLAKGGGGSAGVKKVELMYAVMITLLAFIFGYFL